MSQEADTNGWHRLSSRVIWIDLTQTLLSLIPALAALWLADSDASGAVWPLLGIAAFGVLGAVLDAVRWLFTSYRVTDTHVERRAGVIFRQHRSLRRERVRSVDVEARLRHRAARLRLVTVGAGQHAAAGESALVLDALTAADARALQSVLLSGGSGPAPETAPAGSTPEAAPARRSPMSDATAIRSSADEVFAAFRPGWVVYNMFNVWAYVLALGVLWGGYWLLTSFGADVDGFVLGLLDWEEIGWLGTVVIAFLVVSVVGAAGLTVNFFTEFWNFELARVPGPEGTQLRTRKGLFTTREVNRDENRIRGVQLTEPVAWRWLGVTDTHVITTGLDVWSMADPAAILPRTDRALARRTAARVLGVDERIFHVPLARHPLAALRRRLWWATLSAAVLAAVLGAAVTLTPVPAGVFWVLAGYLPVALLGAVIAYRNLGHAVVGPYVIKRSGLVNRTTVVLRRDAVSTVAVSESLFQRRLGLRTVHAMTAAGYGAYAFPDVAAADSTELARTAAPGLLDEFLAEQPVRVYYEPASREQRLLAPDLARGVMLLLIAMAYASIYIGGGFGSDAGDQPWWDRVAVGASTLLLDNRAFPMFAILFGYGLAWSVRRRRARGVGQRDIRRGLRRRAWLLLLIGALHAVLVYPGEILTSYGLALLVTGWLLFRSGKALWVAAGVTGLFYLVTVPVTMLLFAWGGEMGDVSAVPGYTSPGDWASRLAGVPVSPLYLAVAYPLFVLVVLGYLAGRAKLVEEPGRHRRTLTVLAAAGIGGSVLGAVPAALVFTGLLDVSWQVEGAVMAVQTLTGVAGGAGYVALFALFSDRLAGLWRAGTGAVAAIGKRSLTFYLLNSVLVALVLHPDLIGLATGPLGALGVAFAAWLVSLALAVFLERAGCAGPMEKLMRRGVYGRPALSGHGPLER